MTMEFRPAQETDIAALVELWDDFMTELHGTVPAATDREIWSARLYQQVGRTQVYVAATGRSLVGFAGVIDHSERDFIAPGVAYLVDLYVLPDQRRHDVGSALLECLMQHVSRTGYSEVRSNTSPSNLAAQACLNRAGFRPLDGFALPGMNEEMYFQKHVAEQSPAGDVLKAAPEE